MIETAAIKKAGFKPASSNLLRIILMANYARAVAPDARALRTFAA